MNQKQITAFCFDRPSLGRRVGVFNGAAPRKPSGKLNVEFRNLGDGAAEIFIFEEIGYWGISAKDFATELKALGDVKTINLHLNSPGGDVFDGAAIYNLLAKHSAEVTVDIDGMALSAASVVALAGDVVRMAENALFMIHDPWSIAMGGKEDMLRAADLLDKVKDTISSVYVAKTGLTKEAVDAAMTAETWYSASEALAAKFVDEVVPNKQMAASFDPSKLRESFKNAMTAKDLAAFKTEFLNQPLPTAGTADELPVDYQFANALLRREIEEQLAAA